MVSFDDYLNTYNYICLERRFNITTENDNKPIMYKHNTPLTGVNVTRPLLP